MPKIPWYTLALALLLIPAAHAHAQKPTSPPPAGKAGAKPQAATTTPPAKQALVERGRYLVTIGGCEDCHTPKKFDPAAGGPVNDESMAFAGHPTGAPDPEGKVGPHDMALIGPTFTSFALPFGMVYSRNITSDKQTGIGSWTEDGFMKAMRTGRTPHGNVILPPMPWPGVGSLTDDDLRAVYAFLQSTKPIHNSVKPASVPKEVSQQIGKSNDKAAKALLRPAAATATAR